MPLMSKCGHPNRIIVGILVTVALSFLAGYLGYTLIGHNEAAVAVPFLGCMFGGSLLIAWLDVYGWRGRDRFGYRPGWLETRDWRWLERRRSSRVMKSPYDYPEDD